MACDTEFKYPSAPGAQGVSRSKPLHRAARAKVRMLQTQAFTLKAMGTWAQNPATYLQSLYISLLL